MSLLFSSLSSFFPPFTSLLPVVSLVRPCLPKGTFCFFLFCIVCCSLSWLKLHPKFLSTLNFSSSINQDWEEQELNPRRTWKTILSMDCQHWIQEERIRASKHSNCSSTRAVWVCFCCHHCFYVVLLPEYLKNLSDLYLSTTTGCVKDFQ
jgi:uncharacterized membrane protein YbaN (DUF454 family)